MRDSAALARSYGVGLHTHLAENDHDVAYSVERFGCRPGDYAESVGWTGPDVWHAHCVKLDDARNRALRARRGPAFAIVRARTCGSRRAARLLRACAPPGCAWASASTARHRTMAAICSAEARLALLLSRVAGDAVRALGTRCARTGNARRRGGAQPRRHRGDRARHGGGFRRLSASTRRPSPARSTTASPRLLLCAPPASISRSSTANCGSARVDSSTSICPR